MTMFSSKETFGLLASPNPYASCMRFFSPQGIHVDQLGEVTLRRLLEKEYVSSPIHVFSLSAGRLVGIEQSGPRQAQNIVNAIERARNTTLARFIYSCGIYSIENYSALELAYYFNDLESLQNADIATLHRRLHEVEAANIYNFFRHPANIDLIDALMKEIRILQPY